MQRIAIVVCGVIAYLLAAATHLPREGTARV